jgi:predicted TIM-barrel fold metal-dependent hydrolase
MTDSLSEGRPTFTTRPPRFPRKIALEEEVMWSCDYPYESYQETGAWFDHLEINDQTRAKIGWQNAQQLLRL